MRRTPRRSPGRWSSRVKDCRLPTFGWAIPPSPRRRPGRSFTASTAFARSATRKSGATVLARFGDSRTAVGGQQPIYMAVHRPSVSPVLYLGSAETWRLRAVDPALFDQFWTKTIRFVAQEHLLQAVVAGLALDRSRQIQCGRCGGSAGATEESQLAAADRPHRDPGYYPRSHRPAGGLDARRSEPSGTLRGGIARVAGRRVSTWRWSVPESAERAVAPVVPRRGAPLGRRESAT